MELDGLHSVLEERDFEGRSFWTPTTPAKPLDGESSKNETRQVNWEESSITPNWCPPEGENFEEYPPGFDPRGRTDGEIGYFELTNSVYQKGLPPLHSFVQINNNSFVDLLARTVSTNSSHGATDLSFPESHFQSHPDDLLCQYLQNNGARAHEEIRCEFPPMLSYDLNLFPETNAYEEYNKRIPQFAPTTPGYTNKMQIKQVEERPGEVPDEVSRMASPHFTCTTPDQVKWAENIQIPDIRNFFVDEQENQMQKNADSSGSIAAAVLHDKESVSDVAILISRNEIQNPEKMEKDQGIDLNKTPGQKPKRKKHRPKVVSERKPRGTTAPKTPKPASAKEKPTVKRKYVRKNGASKANSLPTEHVATDDPKTPEPARKSCKKSLNFELENQERCISFEDRIQSTVQIDQRTEATAENIQQSVVNGVTRRADEMSGNRVSLPDFLRASGRDEKISQTNEATRLSKQGKLVQILHEFDVRSSPISPEDSNCSTSTNLASSKKRGQYPYLINQANPSTHNIIGIQYNSLAAYERIFSVNESNGIPGIYFPKVYKRRRSEKAQATHTHGAANANDLASRPDCHLSGALNNASAATLPTEMCHQNQWIFNSIQALGRIERLRKKRSERPTRPRYSTSMAGTAEQKWLHNFLTMQASMNGDARRVMAYHPRTFIEAQANISATMARRKRSARRRNSSVSYLSPRTGILYDNSLALVASSGPNKKVGKLMQSIDALVEKMKGLHISRESYQAARKRYNALVPYNMVGTIIPYPIKRRRPRPKVELDEETTRVWKLLLENIDNEGIDGTDEANIKWWDEVRRRSGEDTNTFISRMRLVQGIRRFSRWGGSVVDSVVGVFLTQNVADHLSSSAFMSLAAHFPLQKRNKEQCYEERVSILTEEPDSSIVDSEETTRSNVTSVNIPVCDQTSVALHDSENSEEKEVVNSNEFSERRNGSPSLIDDSKCKLLNSFGSNLEMYHGAASGRLTAQFLDTETAAFERTAEEIVSSQSSVISSQSSVESSAAQTARRTISCQESYPGQKNEASTIQSESPHDSTSFMELLHKAGNSMLTDLFSHQSGHISYDSHLKDVHNKSEIECSGQEEYRHEAAVPESSSKVHGIPSTNNQFHPNSKIRVPEVEELYAEENRYHGIMTEEWKKQMANSQESTKFCTDANQYNSFHEDRHDINQSNTEHGAGPKNVAESKSQGKSTAMHQSLRALEEILDVTESNCLSSTQKSTENRSVGTHPRGSGTSSADSFSKINAIAPKENKGGNSQDKSNQFDWDSLRRQAEANCGRRDKRSAKTMDSVDWEAVRTADVNEIANTIKERGMNNVLAERIKDFLHRLVREHGSIDLEWLRDVPPDKAKEYLLSIRGLGLKSVECVRLLTLHHLAFPVDTNVGRIAVRLGWVPLQPLPESLQLHLLELYPVLESIQKYLWPRLCKLDQETLYELHYQMITFGKVFCTKNKPNCNACPMRAECRHFASAFASARLALPGPDEKSMVTATEQRANQKPLVTTKLLQLDLHQESQQTEENQPPCKESGIVSCQPIVEEPASPEPEHTQIASDIEDAFSEVPDEIPTIKLNIEAFTQNLHNYMQGKMELQEHDMSKALVALTPEIASIPVPKLKNVSRLRTEHQVYELPDSHPLLKGLDMREPDDPCPYLLAIWTPGETATSIQPPEMRCSSQEFGNLCEYETCFSCNSIREANSQTVRGTLLIPCRTAMRGSFPLNGTYFQVNEVFADHDSSINPVPVPRDWIWNLPRRTVYFGTSIPTIFKGLSTESIQFCFWRGYVCVRGFDQKTRAPRPLLARLHFPASKLNKTKGQTNGK